MQLIVQSDLGAYNPLPIISQMLGNKNINKDKS